METTKTHEGLSPRLEIAKQVMEGATIPESPFRKSIALDLLISQIEEDQEDNKNLVSGNFPFP